MYECMTSSWRWRHLVLSMVEVKICCRMLGRFFVSMHRNARPDGSCLISLQIPKNLVNVSTNWTQLLCFAEPVRLIAEWADKDYVSVDVFVGREHLREPLRSDAVPADDTRTQSVTKIFKTNFQRYACGTCSVALDIPSSRSRSVELSFFRSAATVSEKYGAIVYNSKN